MSVPQELPGELEQWLKGHVARMCGLTHERFPGAQPISFGTRDLAKLELQDFWVCEKSDGIRVLLLVHTDLNSNDQMIYIIDRKNTYRALNGLYFPHHEDPKMPLRNSLVDGELVIDVDPVTTRETLRFLAFDCLVVDDQNVMSRPLDKRYGRLTEWMIRDHPHMASTGPFEIKVKEIRSSYHVDQVFNVDIPALHHANDGLIYTRVDTPYIPGSDPNIMKWKPPSENSIDFKLLLRFPPLSSNPLKPDFHAKPVFLLHYEQFDELYVEDEEWENCLGDQYDDRIVEVHWDPVESHWRLMRFRDDKLNGNHRKIVEDIITSISDGVEKEALLSRCTAIRNAWKSRQAQSQPQSALAPRAGRPAPALPDNNHHHTAPVIMDLRYGPVGVSRWSKVAGPASFAGMIR
ncbi:mRNA guanylyltransferase [Mycena floridula]|nr:mRNA guanylyltransferase [Mycena floridula]